MKTHRFSRLLTLGKQTRGKLRRFFLCFFQPAKVAERVSRREGECDQCGACCKIVFSCPFLAEYGTHTACRIYNSFRPMACQAFPLDQKDLADVEFNCTFFFPESGAEQKHDVPIIPVWEPWKDRGSSA
ncbi:MAG: hypothetical protein ACYC9S_03635 [Leptospirales bacterium]